MHIDKVRVFDIRTDRARHIFPGYFDKPCHNLDNENKSVLRDYSNVLVVLLENAICDSEHPTTLEFFQSSIFIVLFVPEDLVIRVKSHHVKTCMRAVNRIEP